jgi:hypothetical protein
MVVPSAGWQSRIKYHLGSELGGAAYTALQATLISESNENFIFIVIN